MSRRDCSRTWQTLLGRLELEVSRPNFETWLRPTRARNFEGRTLVIEANSSFAADWLNDGLAVVVQRVVDDLVGPDLDVRFVPRTLAADPCSLGIPEAEGPGPCFGNINPCYRHERFQEGEGNRLALDASRALVSSKGDSISPVVVWGSSGTGKSHLLHAVAAEACDRGWRVACISAEEFTTLYMSAVRRGSVEEFQAAIRGVNMLALDDVQYLAGKKGTVDELVRTLDSVANAGGVVVAATDDHPAELALPDRLKSRLAAGIVAGIGPLGRHERLAYIDRVTSQLRATLPSWAVERIVGMETPSMRILQGATHAAVALVRSGLLTERRLDAELIRLSVRESGGHRSLSSREILDIVAAQFDSTPEDIAGRSRAGRLREARAASVAALKVHGRSLSEIGALLGARDASTISELAERGRTILDGNPALQQRLAG